MFDLTFQAIFVRAAAYLVVATVQGLAGAVTAMMLGDPGPRYDGRFSLSPARHADALGAAGFILFGLGWSRFLSVDPQCLRTGRAGLVLVVLGGAAALVATAIALRLLVAPVLTTLPVSGALIAAAFLRSAAALAVANAVFGLLPLTPLPGGHLLAMAGVHVPQGWHIPLGLLLLVLIATGTAGGLIAPGVDILTPYVQGWSSR